MEVIIKGSGVYNNHSEVDGIGAKVASIPKDIFYRLMAMDAFDWIWDGSTTEQQNSNMMRFLFLNPQFLIDKRMTMPNRQIPMCVVNKDNTLWNLNTLKPFKERQSKDKPKILPLMQ